MDQQQAMEEERRRQEEEAQRQAEEAQRQAEEAARKAQEEAAKKAAEQAQKAAADQTKQAQDRQATIEANKKAAEENARRNARMQQGMSLADIEREHNAMLDANRAPRDLKGPERAEYWQDYIHDRIPSIKDQGVEPEVRSRGAGNGAETEMKIDRWLDPDYKMSRDERKEAQGIVRDFNRQYGSQGQLADEGTAARIAELDNKSRAGGSFMAGFMRPIMNASNAVQKGADWLLGGSAELAGGMVDDLAGTNLEGAARNAREQINEARDQNNAFLRDTYQNAQTQNNLAYQGGNLAGNAALYAATNPIFDGLGTAAGLGKVGTAVLNQAGQNAQDLVLDTLPNYMANKEAGMSDEEAAREARNSILTNAAGNALIGGGLPLLGKGINALRGMRNGAESIAKDADNILPALAKTEQAQKAIPNAAEMARQNAEGVDNILAGRQQAADNIEQLSKQIPAVQSADEMAQEAAERAQREAFDQMDIESAARQAADDEAMQVGEQAAREYADREALKVGEQAARETAEQEARDALPEIVENVQAGLAPKHTQSKAVADALNLQPTEREILINQDGGFAGNGFLRKALTTNDTEMSDMTMEMAESEIRDILSRAKYQGNPKLETAAKEIEDTWPLYRQAYEAGDKKEAKALSDRIQAAMKRFDYNGREVLADDGTVKRAAIEGYESGSMNRAGLKKSVGQPAHYMKDLSDSDPFNQLRDVLSFDNRDDPEKIDLARKTWNDIMSEVESRMDMSRPGAKEAYDHFWDATMDQTTRGDNATRKKWAEAYDVAREFMNEDIPEDKIDNLLKMDLQLFSNDVDAEFEAARQAIKARNVESRVANNTLRRSGYFTDQEYDDLIEPISKYTPQPEQETMEVAKRRLIDDHDGTLQRYTRENPNYRSFGAADVDTMMLALYEQKELMRNAADEAVRQQARENVRKISLTLRKTGTENGRAIQAFAKWTRTAEGAVAAADAAAQGQVEDFLKKNPKLSKEIDDVAGELSERLKGAFEGQGSPENRKKVIDLINEVLRNHNKVGKRINDEGVNKLADSIMKDKAYDSIQNQLEFLSTGFSEVDEATIEQVNKLYDEMEALNFNSKEYVQKETEAFQLLANQLSHGKSFKDKFDQWRYFSMLANPTTHIRNVVGNLSFRGINGAKDTLAAAIEKSADAISKITGNGGIDRTKSFLTSGDKDLIKACREDGMQNAYRELTGNKYTGAARGVEGQMPTWNPKKASGRVMNKLADANTAALNKEDEGFVFWKFQRAMAGFLKANGADASVFTKNDAASRELVEQARNYAIGQAKIAAFHQEGAFGSTASAFASGVNNFRNSDNAVKKALGLAADITIPFKKTPANILESALAYSPLELAKTFTVDTHKLVKGTMKAADYIDDLSKGLTGTAGLALGAILAREGILSVNTRQTDRGANFDKQTGRQNLAVKVGDTYIGLDQLIPSAAPLIYGATIYDAMNGDDDNALDAIVTGSTALANGVTDMTMLSGIADALSSVRYANSDADVWGAVGNNLAGNLASQMLPTLGRKIETTADDTRRSTYTDKTGSFSKFADQEGKYLSTKIPGLQAAGEKMQQSENPVLQKIGDKVALEPDIDAKGQERKNTGVNVAQRAVNNFINPLNVTKDTSTPLDDERRRLAEATGNDKIIPSIASSESKIGDHKLTPKEWTDYRKDRGQTREELADAFYQTKGYQDLSDADKADVYSTIESLSKSMAQSGYGKELSTKDQRYKDIYDKDGAEAVVKAIRDDFVLSDIAKAAGGEDAKVTDKLREIYDKKGEKAAKEYAEAYKGANADGGSITIQNVLDYAKRNPNVSSDTLKAIMPSNAAGKLEKVNGEWVYKDKKGEVAKTGMTEKEQKIAEKQADQLKDYGLNKQSVTYTYDKAQQTIPGLTMKDFATTYKKIDTNGNQGITQDELISYFNSSKISPEDAQKLWTAYGSSRWKKKPVNSNGTWKKK